MTKAEKLLNLIEMGATHDEIAKSVIRVSETKRAVVMKMVAEYQNEETSRTTLLAALTDLLMNSQPMPS